MRFTIPPPLAHFFQSMSLASRAGIWIPVPVPVPEGGHGLTVQGFGGGVGENQPCKNFLTSVGEKGIHGSLGDRVTWIMKLALDSTEACLSLDLRHEVDSRILPGQADSLPSGPVLPAPDLGEILLLDGIILQKSTNDVLEGPSRGRYFLRLRGVPRTVCGECLSDPTCCGSLLCCRFCWISRLGYFPAKQCPINDFFRLAEISCVLEFLQMLPSA